MKSRNWLYISQLVDVLEIQLILFLFPWIFKSLSSKMLLISHLCDDVTSLRHVIWRHKTWFTHLSLWMWMCEKVDSCWVWLILFLFPWFCRSLSSKVLYIFHLCDDVASWRHVMTSQNRIYLSQLVDVLESWFFFCFHGFQVTEFENVIYFSFVWWRDVMASCHDVTLILIITLQHSLIL